VTHVITLCRQKRKVSGSYIRSRIYVCNLIWLGCVVLRNNTTNKKEGTCGSEIHVRPSSGISLNNTACPLPNHCTLILQCTVIFIYFSRLKVQNHNNSPRDSVSLVTKKPAWLPSILLLLVNSITRYKNLNTREYVRVT